MTWLPDLRRHLLEEAQGSPVALGARAAARFGISRQAVHVHLSRLLDEGLLEASGRTRARVYRLATLGEAAFDVPLDAAVDEEAVWRARALPALAGALPDALEIARFGLTECLRNAADHSGSPRALVRVRRSAAAIEISIADQGIGILRDLSPLDLVKGTRSTLAAVARAADAFSIGSGACLLRREGTGEWTLEELAGRARGTTVAMRVGTLAPRTLAEALAPPSRLRLPVRLALRPGESPTSRAAARRLLDRLDETLEIVLDFRGIPAVGPAFADEVRRRVSVAWVGTSEPVERALRAAAGSGGRV